MYRIRSTSGTEEVYDSLEEFTAAVRRGDVAPEDEIFHQRANRWLGVNSHPHYRGAINYSGPLTPQVVPPQAPVASAPPLAPPVNEAPVPVPLVRGQVVQLPVASRHQPQPQQVPQTVFRPQLVVDTPEADPAPPPPKAALPEPPIPMQKSKEIPFIDLGDSRPVLRPDTAGNEGRRASGPHAPTHSGSRPAVPPTAQPAAKQDEDFLVLNGGLERSLRTSNGHRAPGDDLDLLFDTPLSQAGPPSPAASSVSAQAPKAQVSSRELEAFKPKAALVVQPKPAPAPVLREEPEDLDLPGPPLFDMSLLEVTPSTEPVIERRVRRPMGLMVGSGAMVMLAAGALLFWRPWAGRTGGSDAPAEEVQTSHPSAPPASTPGATTPTPIGATAAAAATTSPELTTTMLGKPADSATLADSTEAPTDDRVIAAVRPTFRTDLPVAEGDLDLGTQVAGTAAPPSTTAGEFARRLETAEKQARQDLASRTAGFRGLLTASRLSTQDGVNQSKSTWTAGADAIRQYRAKIARLEQAYEDSVLATQRSQGWSTADMRSWAGHQSLAEPAETSQSADLMFNQVTEGLDILASLEGEYVVKGDALHFKNPSAASRYLSVRSWIDQRVQAWASVPESARPQTVNLVMRALGEGLPPVE